MKKNHFHKEAFASSVKGKLMAIGTTCMVYILILYTIRWFTGSIKTLSSAGIILLLAIGLMVVLVSVKKIAKLYALFFKPNKKDIEAYKAKKSVELWKIIFSSERQTTENVDNIARARNKLIELNVF